MSTKADGSLLFTPNNREARRYRRAVDVVVLLAAFWSFCFSLYFFALIRCLCHATFLVLFIVFLLSYTYKYSWFTTLPVRRCLRNQSRSCRRFLRHHHSIRRHSPVRPHHRGRSAGYCP